jgi:redox-sensing transcriptional repressor
LYWRAVNLMSARGHIRISSMMLADISHINPWQIRKNLSYFGAFGTRGVGYDTDKLREKIGDILSLNGTQKAVLVGVGNLGIALLKYPGFKLYGFDIVAAFDNDKHKIGQTVNGITVQNTSKLCGLRERKIYIGIIAVPHTEAQYIARKLIDMGVCGLLNFAPLTLKVPKRVTIINIDIALDLARLPYYMPAKLAGRRINY